MTNQNKPSTFSVKQVEKDVVALIQKHYPHTITKEVNVFGEKDGLEKEGFYLMFMRRDENNKKARIAVYTLGSNMSIQDIVESFAAKIADTAAKSTEKMGIA